MCGAHVRHVTWQEHMGGQLRLHQLAHEPGGNLGYKYGPCTQVNMATWANLARNDRQASVPQVRAARQTTPHTDDGAESSVGFRAP